MGGKRVEEGGREEGGSLWEVGAMGGWKVGGTWREEGGGRTGSKLPPKPSCCPNSLRRVMMMMTFILILILILLMVLMMAKADHHFTDIALISPITNICQIISLSIVSG